MIPTAADTDVFSTVSVPTKAFTHLPHDDLLVMRKVMTVCGPSITEAAALGCAVPGQ
jgi:hypothetical protein